MLTCSWFQCIFFRIFNKYRIKPFVRETHRHTQSHMDTDIDNTDSSMCSGSWNTHTDDESHEKHGVENSHLDFFLVKWLQGELFLYLSLMWHRCCIGGSEFIPTVYNPNSCWRHGVLSFHSHCRVCIGVCWFIPELFLSLSHEFH